MSANSAPKNPVIGTAQAAATDAIFDKTNSHLRAKYSTIGALYKAVRPALREIGAGIVFDTAVLTVGEVLLLEVTGRIFTGGESYTSRVSYPLNPGYTPQQVNAAVTYGKKAIIQNLFAITSTEEEESDDDGESVSAPPKQVGPPASDEQITAIREGIKRVKGNDDPSTILARFGKKSLEALTEDEANDALRLIAGAEKKIAKAQEEK